MGRGGGVALPTVTGGDVLMVVNISMIVLVTVVVASCTGNYGCAGLLPRCHDGERRALLQMKKYALVNYSSVMGDWPGVAGGEDCCQWSGITCNNHTGRVIRIDLLPMLDISHPNLASTLVQFKELESLDLVWSTIGGTLPNLVCNFKHLKQLQLYGSVNSSSSSRSIPSCLGNLNDLELILNGIDDTFPEGLCNMRTLTGLDITGNRISGVIPSCLGNLHNLERLHLRGNKISGTIPDGLCLLKHLNEIDLWANELDLRQDKISGTIPDGIFNISTLTGIDFFGNRINGTIPSCLGNLHNLEMLDLSDNKIGGTIPEGLCNLRHLKGLGLYENLLEGPIPQCLCSMRSLAYLGLSGNHLNGTIPSCLGNLHNLEVLDVEDNEVQGSIPPSIFPNLTKLRQVRIGGRRLEGTFSFSPFANLSNLEVIDIKSSKHGLEIEIVESPSCVPYFQLRLLIVYGCSVVNKGNGGGGGRFLR